LGEKEKEREGRIGEGLFTLEERIVVAGKGKRSLIVSNDRQKKKGGLGPILELVGKKEKGSAGSSCFKGDEGAIPALKLGFIMVNRGNKKET